MLFIAASFGKKSSLSFEPFFDGRSSFELCLDSFSKAACESKKIAVFCDEFSSGAVKSFLKESQKYGDIYLVEKKSSDWTSACLCEEIYNACEKCGEEDAVLGFSDRPFYNVSLTNNLIELHTKYKAEYTFADGYINGTSPVAVNKGASKIIYELGKEGGLQSFSGQRLVSEIIENDGSCPVFSILQGDINSFEIETVIAQEDFRILRADLSVSKKINRLACQNAFEIIKKIDGDFSKIDAETFCGALKDKISVLKTVPAFYNIQLCSDNGNMSLENFKKLIKNADAFSEGAYFSLSAFFDLTRADALSHPDFAECVKAVLENENNSIFIETDGKKITDDFLKKLCDELILNKMNPGRIFWAVEIAPSGDFKNGLSVVGDGALYIEKISLLNKYFPHNVYPQFTRTQKTEKSLENFYRYWSKKESESEGNVLIQKFNNYCGSITELSKTADLSPLDRNPCWHLRRDMTVLCDGTVPMCMQTGILNSSKENVSGNVFTESIEEIWKKSDSETENHIHGNYCQLCRKCDEYYTFNF